MKTPGTGRVRASLIAMSAGSIVAGCSALRDYEVPQMGLSDHYSMLQPIAVSSHPDTAWWKSFNDPTLDELIERAAGQNLTIAQARARVREARRWRVGPGLTILKGQLTSPPIPTVESRRAWSWMPFSHLADEVKSMLQSPGLIVPETLKRTPAAWWWVR
jgi:hypothetical protein